MSCRDIGSVDTRRIESSRCFAIDKANTHGASFSWRRGVSKSKEREASERRLSARPAAIATGTSVTIATATPDTRERCHNDKPCAARRYGAPEPGNRCERLASRGAERSRVGETRISWSQNRPPLHPPPTRSSVRENGTKERPVITFKSVFWCRALPERFNARRVVLVTLCFCCPAPRECLLCWCFLYGFDTDRSSWYGSFSCCSLHTSVRFDIIIRNSSSTLCRHCRRSYRFRGLRLDVVVIR